MVMEGVTVGSPAPNSSLFISGVWIRVDFLNGPTNPSAVSLLLYQGSNLIEINEEALFF